jgi:hypothetical protein
MMLFQCEVKLPSLISIPGGFNDRSVVSVFRHRSNTNDQLSASFVIDRILRKGTIGKSDKKIILPGLMYPTEPLSLSFGPDYDMLNLTTESLGSVGRRLIKP